VDDVDGQHACGGGVPLVVLVEAEIGGHQL